MQSKAIELTRLTRVAQNVKHCESAFVLTAIGHGGYLTFRLAGCGRLFGADFDLVGDFQRLVLSANSELAIAISLISMG